MVKLHMHQVFSDNFFTICKCPLLFGSFLELFFFLSLINREFWVFWKNKYRRKYVRKEEEDVEGSRIFQRRKLLIF